MWRARRLLNSPSWGGRVAKRPGGVNVALDDQDPARPPPSAALDLPARGRLRACSRFLSLRPSIAAALVAACLLAAAAPLALRAAVAGVELPSLKPETGVLVVDRDGVLLRPFAVADGRWRLPTMLADVDPGFVETLLAYEDRRFREHRGVDVRALARAAFQVVRHGRPVSGGSTITMQVARLLGGRSTRSAGGKLDQILTALALERALSKDELLELYMKLAPYGGNIEGIRAASLAYFGKEPR
nr:transglycosylase domain-containing protein [Hyphomicrobiales bacterium]